MRSKRWIGMATAAVMGLGLSVGTASATMTYQWSNVDNSAGGSALDGYVTQDLLVNTDTDWTAAEIVVTLTSGTVYQDALAGTGITRASQALIGVPGFAHVGFDTYLTGGTNADPTSTAEAASSAGNAADLTPGSPALFDATGINAEWNNTATDNIGNLMLGRVTLSDDAAGTWQLLLINAANEKITTPVTAFSQGSLVGVPEPASLALLGLGGLALLIRRRGQRVA